MPHYLVRWQFKDATAKGFLEKPQDRTAPANTFCRKPNRVILRAITFACGDKKHGGV